MPGLLPQPGNLPADLLQTGVRLLQPGTGLNLAGPQRPHMPAHRFQGAAGQIFDVQQNPHPLPGSLRGRFPLRGPAGLPQPGFQHAPPFRGGRLPRQRPVAQAAGFFATFGHLPAADGRVGLAVVCFAAFRLLPADDAAPQISQPFAAALRGLRQHLHSPPQAFQFAGGCLSGAGDPIQGIGGPGQGGFQSLQVLQSGSFPAAGFLELLPGVGFGGAGPGPVRFGRFPLPAGGAQGGRGVALRVGQVNSEAGDQIALRGDRPHPRLASHQIPAPRPSFHQRHIPEQGGRQNWIGVGAEPVRQRLRPPSLGRLPGRKRRALPGAGGDQQGQPPQGGGFQGGRHLAEGRPVGNQPGLRPSAQGGGAGGGHFFGDVQPVEEVSHHLCGGGGRFRRLRVGQTHRAGPQGLRFRLRPGVGRLRGAQAPLRPLPVGLHRGAGGGFLPVHPAGGGGQLVGGTYLAGHPFPFFGFSFPSGFQHFHAAAHIFELPQVAGLLPFQGTEVAVGHGHRPRGRHSLLLGQGAEFPLQGPQDGFVDFRLLAGLGFFGGGPFQIFLQTGLFLLQHGAPFPLSGDAGRDRPRPFAGHRGDGLQPPGRRLQPGGRSPGSLQPPGQLLPFRGPLPRFGLQGGQAVGLFGGFPLQGFPLRGQRPGAFPQPAQFPAALPHSDGPEAVAYLVVTAGGLRLAAQRPAPPFHFRQKVVQTEDVGAGALQAAFGFGFAHPVFADAGRLLDYLTALLPPSLQNQIQAALADDQMLLTSDSPIGQQFLDVQQPATHPVYLVFGLAVPVEAAGDGHLVQIQGQGPVGVVQQDRRLGPSQRPAGGGARENNLFHLVGAQPAGGLRAQRPGHRVHDVGLAGAVGSDHHRHPRLELQPGAVGEGLESRHA